MSATTIWRIEGGKLDPRPATRGRIMLALGFSDEDSFFSKPFRLLPTDGALRNGINAFESNVEGFLEDLRPPGTALLPIYQWGACGDPRDAFSAPDPVDHDYAPIGEERLIGPNGKGIRIKGESLANRDIHDGDTVWANPDMPPRIGRVVLARVWGYDITAYDSVEDGGMVVKVWKNRDGIEGLWGDGDGHNGSNPVLCSRYEVIAPVVWVQPQGHPPR